MRRLFSGLQAAVLTGTIVVSSLGAAVTPQPALAAEGFANDSFRSVWTRTDQPVESQAVRRSWIWGDNALNARQEAYSNSPGGRRQVQYFDKSRMEINNPSTGEVTNGLLAIELITGRRQVGDSDFEQRAPALVNVAGDPGVGNGPSYAHFGGKVNIDSSLDMQPIPVGVSITETLQADGQTGEDPGKANYGVTSAYLVPETNSSIASVFWDFLNEQGPVRVGNTMRDEELFEPWYFATGFPISRPYWTRATVGGVERDVLVQAFQRRVLTYTPDNPDGWKVEMGNIGRHYYVWRYGEEPTPAARAGSQIGYGVNGFFTFNPVTDLNNIERSLDMVNDIGFGYIRQQVIWATLEPTRGQFEINQLATYDAIVREANERNLKVMFSIVKSPRWAVASDVGCQGNFCGLPADNQVWADSLRRFMERYNTRTSPVVAIEVWNEQNLGHETANNVNPGVYVEFLKVSYNTIKAVDRNMIVVYGGLSPTGHMVRSEALDDAVYLEESYQYNNGEMKNYFDVMGAHPGSNNNPPDAFWPDNPGPGTGCAEGGCWQRHQSFYFRRIEQLRAIMEKYGDGDKKMWLTEFGWSTKNEAPGYEYGAVISEELQAQYITRAYEKARQEYPWMGVMFLWTLNHSVVVPPTDEKYPWSLVRGDWSPRPSYFAVKNMPK